MQNLTTWKFKDQRHLPRSLTSTFGHQDDTGDHFYGYLPSDGSVKELQRSEAEAREDKASPLHVESMDMDEWWGVSNAFLGSGQNRSNNRRKRRREKMTMMDVLNGQWARIECE